jgi:hypothetical protein
MTYHFAVPTRNNIQGLCALVSSLISLTIRPGTKQQVKLSICDSSEIPAITDKYFSRLAGYFVLNYQHTKEAGLINQRLKILETLNAEEVILFLDDDHVLLDDPLEAFQDFIAGAKIDGATPRAYFGSSVDLFNDRGFADYRFFDDVDSWSEHAFTRADKRNSRLVIHPDLAEFSANAGHMLSSVGNLIELYRLAAAKKNRVLDGVYDDAIARNLAAYCPVGHNRMEALHIGNSNNNWSPALWPTKHEAVKAAQIELFRKGG